MARFLHISEDHFLSRTAVIAFLESNAHFCTHCFMGGPTDGELPWKRWQNLRKCTPVHLAGGPGLSGPCRAPEPLLKTLHFM